MSQMHAFAKRDPEVCFFVSWFSPFYYQTRHGFPYVANTGTVHGVSVPGSAEDLGRQGSQPRTFPKHKTHSRSRGDGNSSVSFKAVKYHLWKICLVFLSQIHMIHNMTLGLAALSQKGSARESIWGWKFVLVWLCKERD